jgi:hypothetical protein
MSAFPSCIPGWVACYEGEDAGTKAVVLASGSLDALGVGVVADLALVFGS